MIHSIERNTSLIALGVLVAAVIFVVIGFLLNQLALPIAAIGIITFFGMLIISGYNKTSTKTKGIMRRAIASALIVSYIIAFSVLMFQNFELQTMPDHTTIETEDLEKYILLQNQTAAINSSKMNFANTVFTNFTNVIMVVIVFYFGSKGVLQYLKDRNPNQVEPETFSFNADSALNKIKSMIKEKEKAVANAKIELSYEPENKKLKTKVNDAENALRVAKEAEIKLKSAKKAVDASQEPSIIKDLQVNITKPVTAPLVAGFYLVISGGQGIKLKKRWHFGDGVEKINNNLIQNHTYHDEGKFTMWVDIVDNELRVIERSKEIEFTVEKKLDKFNFDQWEGVIAEGDDVGFSLGGNIKGEDKIKWVWGDGQELDKEINPHHPYEKAGTYQGEVSVGGEKKEFGVLVLPDRIKHIAGHIEVTDASQRDGSFPAKKKLNFQVQVTGGTPEYHVTWKFGDTHGGAGKMTKHSYKESGNYHVSCTVRDKNGLTFSFDTNVTIV